MEVYMDEREVTIAELREELENLDDDTVINVSFGTYTEED